MDKKSVEEYILERYPDYISRLKKIEEGLIAGVQWYQEKHPELIKKGDFRPGTLSRFVSCITITRFFKDRMIDFVSKSDWDEEYLKEYLPELSNNQKYFGGFRDLDTILRSNLFHCVFHQLETTIRIIHAKLELKWGKPSRVVNEELGVFPDDFLDCFEALRNTIHNNGFYKPLSKQPDDVKYKSEFVDLHFEKDKKVTVTTHQTISIISEALIYAEKMLKHEKVKSIPPTDDMG